MVHRALPRSMEAPWTHTFPRDGAGAAKLVFEHGLAPRVTVRGAPLGDTLARCRFEGEAPVLAARGNELRVDYRGFFRWFFLGRMAPGDVEINAEIPWTIHIDGGVARTDLDLSGIDLRQFEIRGGAARVELTLGKPRGIVPLRITGGAARLAIRHPPGVASRLRVGGGVAHLDYGEQRLGAVGGGIALESRGWDAAGDGYDIKIGGGAAHLAVLPEGTA